MQSVSVKYISCGKAGHAVSPVLVLVSCGYGGVFVHCELFFILAILILETGLTSCYGSSQIWD